MRFWNSARYVVAIILLVSVPPSVLLWVAIHPFAAFWRRLGPVWTYAILGIPVAGYMAGAWFLRETLLGADLGTRLITMILAGIVIAAAVLLKSRVQRRLTFGLLSGMPELSKEKYPGSLLTDGIYGRIRNPRYVEVFLWNLAYALFANYAGSYAIVALYVLAISLVVRMEEKELRQRFGAAYDEYCRRVPRFVPKRRANRV